MSAHWPGYPWSSGPTHEDLLLPGCMGSEIRSVFVIGGIFEWRATIFTKRELRESANREVEEIGDFGGDVVASLGQI